MCLEFLCLILFPLCLLPHPNTSFPPPELLFIPQDRLSVSFLEAFLSPKGERLRETVPSPLGPHSLVSPLQWCLAGCHPVPHLTPQSRGSTHCQQHPYLPGAKGRWEWPLCASPPPPRVNFQSSGGRRCDASETVGIFAAAQQPQVALFLSWVKAMTLRLKNLP